MSNSKIKYDTSGVILVTGSNGYIGSKVVETLLRKGYLNIRCLTRKTSDKTTLENIIDTYPEASIEIIEGDLLNKGACKIISKDVKIIYHLAAGMNGGYSAKYLNSVVATKNLIEAALESRFLTKFVNVSSFSVYSNYNLRRRSILDENCPTVENEYSKIHNSYAFAKTEQDKMVIEYGVKHNLPYVIMRPGSVYGPGAREKLTTHVGNKTFGILLHIRGSNLLPLTYIDNCAEAIVLAGLVENVAGEIINIVDDDKITSRKFLKLYKKNVFWFPSIFVPYRVFYIFSMIWEIISHKSHYHIPAIINRHKTAFFWKGNKYTNKKLHELLGWNQTVPFKKGSQLYFQYMKETIKDKKIC